MSPASDDAKTPADEESTPKTEAPATEAEAPAKPEATTKPKAKTATPVADAETEAPAKTSVTKAKATAAGTAKATAAATAKAADAAAAAGGTAVALADLPADIFDAKVNVPLIHQVVVAQQAAARQGTHSTKTRGEVRGGGKKPYRQKGTGRARQGSIRAPQFTGGGVVHGPVPRSYVQKTPKKMNAAALRGALSDRARHGLVYVVDSFVDGDEPRTRDALAALTVATGTAPDTTAMLVVAETSDKVTWKSLRNVAGVHMIDPGQLNTYDVLVSDRVVFTAAALASFVARAGRPGRGEGEER
jgi:large subunit ribosomal protein L4